MDNLKELVKFLREKNDKILGLDNEKQFISIFFEIIKSIEFIDKVYIKYLKEKDRNLFLFYTANLKDLLNRFIYYIDDILPSIKSFYTKALEIEIINIQTQISNLKEELFFNKITNDKEKLEKEYEEYIKLVNENKELLEKKTLIDSINIEEIREEYKIINLKIDEIDFEISKLEKSREIYENKIVKNLNIEKEVEEINSNYKSNNEFLFERFLFLIKEFQNNINDKSDFYSEQLEYSVNFLKNKENELKIFVSEVKEKKDEYKKKTDIINNHFISNKGIINNIKNLDENIYKKISSVEKSLLEIDYELAKYIKNEQKLINEIINLDL